MLISVKISRGKLKQRTSQKRNAVTVHLPFYVSKVMIRVSNPVPLSTECPPRRLPILRLLPHVSSRPSANSLPPHAGGPRSSKKSISIGIWTMAAMKMAEDASASLVITAPRRAPAKMLNQYRNLLVRR